MSKNKTKEETLANPKGKTVEELKEIALTLQTQLDEHKKLEDFLKWYKYIIIQ